MEVLEAIIVPRLFLVDLGAYVHICIRATVYSNAVDSYENDKGSLMEPNIQCCLIKYD